MITLNPDRHSLNMVIEELDYTIARLAARPFGKSRQATFEGLLAMAEKTSATELQLRRTLLRARALVDEVDDNLDDFVRETSRLSENVIGQTGQRLRESLFANKRPSEVIRPKLGEELEHVRSWPQLLRAAPTQGLIDQAAPLETLLQQGDEVQTAVADALAALARFKTGERATLFDTVNAERRGLDGEAGKYAAAHPGERDPSRGLFRSAASSRGADEATVEALRMEVAQAETALIALKDRLSTAEALQEKQAAEDQARQALEKAAAEAEAMAIAATQKATELRAKLKKPSTR